MDIIKFIKTLFKDETKRELEECEKAYALEKYKKTTCKQGLETKYFWEGYGVNADKISNLGLTYGNIRRNTTT
jgi:hypothetical protein